VSGTLLIRGFRVRAPGGLLPPELRECRGWAHDSRRHDTKCSCHGRPLAPLVRGVRPRPNTSRKWPRAPPPDPVPPSRPPTPTRPDHSRSAPSPAAPRPPSSARSPTGADADRSPRVSHAWIRSMQTALKGRVRGIGVRSVTCGVEAASVCGADWEGRHCVEMAPQRNRRSLLCSVAQGSCGRRSAARRISGHCSWCHVTAGSAWLTAGAKDVRDRRDLPECCRARHPRDGTVWRI
jgi:hypothetical protein